MGKESILQARLASPTEKTSLREHQSSSGEEGLFESLLSEIFG